MENEKFKQLIWNDKSTRYAVGTKGTVYNMETGKCLIPSITNKGYFKLSLCIDRKRVKVLVHRLVALTYVPNPDNKPCVNHIDGCKTNNSVENLEWVTQKENIIHAARNGLISHVSLSNEQVHTICKYIKQGLSDIEIAKMFDTTKDIIYRIRVGDNYKDISKNYNIVYTKKRNIHRLSEHKVRQICEMRKKGLSYPEISKILDISIKTLHAMHRTPKWASIMTEYELPVFEHGKYRYLYDAIDRMLLDGIKTKVIYEVIGINDKNIHQVIYYRKQTLKRLGQIP